MNKFRTRPLKLWHTEQIGMATLPAHIESLNFFAKVRQNETYDQSAEAQIKQVKYLGRKGKGIL